nr:unnamed protein product [Callosobruchus chinensis]
MTHPSVVLWAVIVQILSESIQIGGQYIGARQRIHNHPSEPLTHRKLSRRNRKIQIWS